MITSLERMQRSLLGQSVDRCPIAPLYLHLYQASWIRSYALQSYQDLLGNDYRISLDPEMAVTIQSAAVRKTWEWFDPAPDWLCVIGRMPTRSWLADSTLQRHQGQVLLVHEPTGIQENLSELSPRNAGLIAGWNGKVLTSENEIDELIPTTTPKEIIAGGSLDVVRALVQELGEKVFIAGCMSTAYSECFAILGFEKLMTMPLDKPKLFRHLLERKHADLLALARAYAMVGVHGMFIEESLTSADIISETIYNEFVFPYCKSLLNELRTLGKPTIYYVTGDITKRLPRLVEISPNALAFEESKKGFRTDLAQIANALDGRITLFGNLDPTALANWSDARLELEMKAQLKAAEPARSFIFSNGSPFPLDTPAERVKEFVHIGQTLRI